MVKVKLRWLFSQGVGALGNQIRDGLRGFWTDMFGGCAISWDICYSNEDSPSLRTTETAHVRCDSPQRRLSMLLCTWLHARFWPNGYQRSSVVVASNFWIFNALINVVNSQLVIRDKARCTQRVLDQY